MKGTRWLPGLLLLASFACSGPPIEEKPPVSKVEAAQQPAAQKDGARAKLAKSGPETAQPLSVFQADYAITKMRLSEASELLEGKVGPDAARARARLAIYQGDCESAVAQLASSAARRAAGGQALFDFATRCTRATVGGLVIEDEKAGIWLRLQDDRDRVLAPLLIEAAEKARAVLQRDLGVVYPRPLRIDLVRDLFSLSAVSGLPLEAAETTGTVAVARWGRITMVSPRAMAHGFPWADTLAHEITHLMLSLATADRAPLWLQEGIAKREEHRYREMQPFDDQVDFAKDAFDAQLSGKSVGVDAIGPSIAMLPSAEAASIAFAEVTAFMGYWIEENGPHALALLLRDMEVSPDADSAMRSVSGFGVSDWQRLWRRELERRYQSAPASEEHSVSELLRPRALMRALRLSELLTVDGYPEAAVDLGSPELDRASHSSALRFLLNRAARLSKRDDADFLLGDLSEVDSADAGWLSLSAARLGRETSNPEADLRLRQARGLDPLLAEVACGGEPWVGKVDTDGADVGKTQGAILDELCREARSLPVRGAR